MPGGRTISYGRQPTFLLGTVLAFSALFSIGVIKLAFFDARSPLYFRAIMVAMMIVFAVHDVMVVSVLYERRARRRGRTRWESLSDRQ